MWTPLLFLVITLVLVGIVALRSTVRVKALAVEMLALAAAAFFVVMAAAESEVRFLEFTLLWAIFAFLSALIFVVFIDAKEGKKSSPSVDTLDVAE